jgi:hypothetical protein
MCVVDQGAKRTGKKAYDTKSSISMIEAIRGAGYGIRTRGLNFGKVACYHYTKPACIVSTTWSIAD